MTSRSKREFASVIAYAAIALGALAVPGCGHKKPAVAPKAAAGASGPVVANDTGQQLGMSDAPSSGEGDPVGRKMNAAGAAAYKRGMALWSAGDIAGARGAFSEATRADPQAYQAFYSLGVMQDRLGEADALASFRQSYSLNEAYEPAIVGYGLSLARRGSLSDADEFLTTRRGKMPRSAAVLAALAEVKSLEKDTAGAQQLAQDALKVNPDFRPAMVVLARDHYRNRRLDLALYALGAILDGEGENNPPRDKNNAEAHLLRAVIYKEQGRRAAAIDELRQVVTLRPDAVEAGVQLAAYMLESGNAADALPLLERAQKYRGDDVVMHLNLGDAYRLLGRVADARREFELVAQKDASLPQVYYSLGLLYLFAPQVPGMDDKQRVSSAIDALEKYQQLRGKQKQGTTNADDSDQLLLRAKAKQGELNAADQAAAAGSAQPAGSAPPAGSAQPADAAPAKP